MGLFDKKYCDICGNQIKFLGNKKVEDGNICKDCSSKLSPFFSDRKSSTIAQIKQQLQYRQQNSINLKSFNPNKIIGKRWKFYIDTNSRKFAVSSSSDYKKANADLIDFNSIQKFEAKVKEDRDEIYTKDNEGKNVSYIPPRYEYEYKFEVKLYVNNPYFDDIDIELSYMDRADSCTSQLFMEYEQMVSELSQILTGKPYVLDKSSFLTTEASYSNNYNYQNSYSQTNTYQNNNLNQQSSWTCPNCGTLNTSNFCGTCGSAKPVIQSANRFCPNCGTKVDSTVRFCPQCGKQLN